MKNKSYQQEKRLASIRGGRRQPGSGNKWWAKEDVIDKIALSQCKITSRKSYTIKLTDLNTLMDHATALQKLAFMEIDFNTGPGIHKRFYIVPEYIFLRHFPKEAQDDST